MSFTRRQKQLLLLCLLWGLWLAVLAVQPEEVVKFFLPTAQARSAAHVAAYGSLAFILILYGRFKRQIGSLRLEHRTLILLVFMLTTLFGAGTEILQLWTPDRCAGLDDLGCDMLGAALGIGAYYGLRGFL